MKIAIITDYSKYTGIWVHNYDLFMKLKRLWLNVDIVNLVSPQWYKETPDYWINIISNIRNNRYLSFWYWVFYKFPKELKKVLKEWKYTHIILGHQWLAYLWKSLQKKIKTIIVVHDLFTLYWDKSGIDELIYNTFLLKWIDKIKNIVFISDFTKNDFDRYYGKLDGHNCRVIYQWIDKRIINEEVKESLIKRYNLEGKKIIINVWSESPRKNIKTYLEVANHFKNNKDFLFVRIWKPSSDSDKYINENKLNNILYCSWISDDELVAWYDLASIILSTSTLEWYWRQIFEWYLYDNYVVTSDVSDVKKIFKWNKSVYIVDSATETSEYIKWVNNMPKSIWTNFGVNGSEWEVSDYIKFLNSL